MEGMDVKARAKALLALPNMYLVPEAADMLYSHRVLLGNSFNLIEQRRALAGFELDPNLIRERYELTRKVPSYRLTLMKRRFRVLGLSTAVVVLTAYSQLERVLDWLEYEVYIK
jgi:hypothetical protein